MDKVVVPRHIEADLVAGLAQYGITAQTIVPSDRKAGTVRISRTGGEIALNASRDNIQVLIEVWGEDAANAYHLAIKVYAALKAMGHYGFITKDCVIKNCEVTPPRSYDDELAPDLYRMNFMLTGLVSLTEIEIGGPYSGD